MRPQITLKLLLHGDTSRVSRGSLGGKVVRLTRAGSEAAGVWFYQNRDFHDQPPVQLDFMILDEITGW